MLTTENGRGEGCLHSSLPFPPVMAESLMVWTKQWKTCLPERLELHDSAQPTESIFQFSLSANAVNHQEEARQSLIQSRDSLWLSPQEPWGRTLTCGWAACSCSKGRSWENKERKNKLEMCQADTFADVDFTYCLRIYLVCAYCISLSEEPLSPHE